MITTTRLMTLTALVLVAGCGDKGGGDEEVGNESSVTQSGTSQGESAGEEQGSQSESAGESQGTSQGESAGTDTATGTDNADENADGNDSAGMSPKWDLGGIPDSAMNCQDFGMNGEFSYLWAANSSQSTISKIDTQTVTEVGRFATRPDMNGSPSRTSVSLSGNVAVANRNGGVTKIYARTEDCDPGNNGMAGLQTSNNNQFLPWGQDDCIAWHTPMAYTSQRPVAWGLGEFNQGTCNYENEEVWTSGHNGGTIDVHVLDGDDGTVVESVMIPTGGNSLQADYFGIYGGAVDGEGNFWGTQLYGPYMVKVNRADMSYEIFPTPGFGYGMTVDSEGFVWLCTSEVGRFDPMTQTWATASVGGYTGCMADAGENGLLWMSDGQGVIGVNRDTLAVEKSCPGGGSYGVSIDFEGYVWSVAYGSLATKWDPETCQSWTYNGLVGAYTYSDMTGYALSNAGTPSG
jgi:hypothetical protein